MFKLDLQRLYKINSFNVPSQGFKMVSSDCPCLPLLQPAHNLPLPAHGKQAVKHTVNKGGKFLKNLWCCVGRRV